MHFASLSGLWFSLSIPFILVLYLLKRRYIDTEVSSHMLWRRVLREQEANRPWQRLSRQLLLLLQLLAASLLVLALMQPFIRSQQTAKSHIFFVLDASASMQTSTDHGTRLEEAKQDILTYAREEAQNRSYSLLVMKDQPELLLQRESNLSSLQAALNKVAPFYGKTNVQEALSLASALTREEFDGEVRIYTDSQWVENAEGVTFSIPVSIQEPGIQRRAGDEVTNPPENVAITQFGVKEIQDSAEYKAVAVVKNWGTVSILVKAELYADSKEIRTDSLNLKGGEQKSIYVDKLPRADVYKLQLNGKDVLEADNTAYAFPEGTGRIQAAYVGEGNLFLEKALTLAKTDILHLQKSSDGTYPLPLGLTPDLIIVDGVTESALKSEVWQRLLSSKPVWRFASAAKSDLEPQQAISASPFSIMDHPISRYIRLQDVNVAMAQTRPLKPWEKAIISSASVPLVLAATEEGIPNLTFTFSLEQSDLALRSEFPILVQNAVAWLTQHHGGNLGRMTAGDRKEIVLHPEATKAIWKTTMEGVKEEEAERNGDALSSMQTAPKLPGLYEFVEYNTSGQIVQTRLLEVVMDPRESNVNGKIESKLVFKPGSEVDAGVDRGKDISLGNTMLNPWLIVILLMLLVLEWEVYRRGHSV
ncbi:vWA domain-containing protein [Paenibacillus alginolyticus]|uniref:BatA and WFA domain-containing protein n=1 Tax=Paenibacillus alginolyticus TaxID=59839 RepID=A0ABT4GCD5_9BACL|nr:VWA domain-containing protein [Paenibacillus alginolyticus]MCY9693814.1 BatA and WFA domain-containing protein [Paenibacillus alginolyticus]MEC0148586.1 VWA domain-containing protein [Paenibacillus alginolyticus]